MPRLLFIALVLLAAATPAGAAPAKPGNGQISFWSDSDFGGRAEVFVMNPDGTGQRRLTSLFSAKRGDFSPDGRRLVFDGRGYDTLWDFDIFVMNGDGTGVQQLTSGPDRDTQASWSPDGQSISFVRAKRSSTPSIWIVDANGRDGHRMASGGSAAWAPSGKRVAVGGVGLRLTDRDGRHVKRIVSGETEVAAWSGDGRRILFTRFIGGNPEVYVVRTDGSRLRRLTRKPGADYAADFSPDGTRILFSSDRGGYLQVYVMNLDGSGVREVSRSQSNDWATSWQALPER